MSKARKTDWTDLERVSVDDQQNLLWDGKRVVTKQRVGLTGYTAVIATLAAAAAVVMAVFAALGYFCPCR